MAIVHDDNVFVVGDFQVGDGVDGMALVVEQGNLPLVVGIDGDTGEVNLKNAKLKEVTIDLNNDVTFVAAQSSGTATTYGGRITVKIGGVTRYLRLFTTPS